MDDLEMSKQLAREYDGAVDMEDRVSSALKLSSDAFTTTRGIVSFSDISVPDPVKKGRKTTYLGLTKSIKELGILVPIHVMVTEGYSDWLESKEAQGEYEGYKYVVLDGFRRLYGGIKNGMSECEAVIWNFKDKELGSDLALLINMLLNRNQKHSWEELWHLYQILEMQSPMSPGTLEFFLHLESGDSMKLKDIMCCNYQEVIDNLLSNKKDLNQCYNMLQKLRKEEDQLLKDDGTGISDVEKAEEIVDSGKEHKVLSDDEVQNILEMSTSFDGELSEDDFDELAGTNLPSDRDTPGDRHPLDPRLRAAVLSRDGYKCVVSGVGEGLPAEIALAILNVHHKVPVHCGGTNDMSNLVTVSLDVHTLIHIIERRNGKLGMSKEEFDKLPDDKKKYIQGVMALARPAVEANRRLGTGKQQLIKETKDSIGLKMPGTDLKINMEAVKSAKEE